MRKIFPEIDHRFSVCEISENRYAVELMFETVVRIERGGRWYEIPVFDRYTIPLDDEGVVDHALRVMNVFVVNCYRAIHLHQDPEVGLFGVVESSDQVSEPDRLRLHRDG